MLVPRRTAGNNRLGWWWPRHARRVPAIWIARLPTPPAPRESARASRSVTFATSTSGIHAESPAMQRLAASAAVMPVGTDALAASAARRIPHVCHRRAHPPRLRSARPSAAPAQSRPSVRGNVIGHHASQHAAAIFQSIGLTDAALPRPAPGPRRLRLGHFVDAHDFRSAIGVNAERAHQ